MLLFELIQEIQPQYAVVPIPLIIAGVQLAMGAIQAYKAQKALKAIEAEPKAQYGVALETQRAYGRAEELAKQGYLPEEQAYFEQQLARESETQFQSAKDISGGNMAQALYGGIQSRNIGAIGQFAASGAELRRQNIRYADTIAARIQEQRNLATQEEIAERNRRLEAFGLAGKAGLENIGEGLATGVAAFAPSGDSDITGGGTSDYWSQAAIASRQSARVAGRI